jgi:sugar O-acyltransferase (sialic acid O-acetyltransferase NeuD family)
MKTIIVGAGGHSRVVYDILRYDHNTEVIAFVDNTPRGSEETIMGVPVRGDHDVIPTLVEEEDVGGFIIAVGDNEIRRGHFKKILDMGLEPVSAIHPEAYISKTATVGSGTVVASGVNVSTNADIGENSILNTGAIVDHETTIGEHVHVAPGSTVAGRVSIGELTFVGMGSTVRDYVDVGENVTVGAGSVVLEDVPSNVTIAGAPAEIKSEKDAKTDEKD